MNRLRHQNNGSILGLLDSLAKLAAKLVLARNAEELYSYFFSGKQGEEEMKFIDRFLSFENKLLSKKEP